MTLPGWWPWAALAAIVAAVGGGGAVVVASKDKDKAGDGDGPSGSDKAGGEMLSPNFSRNELDPYREASGAHLANLKTLCKAVLEPLRAAHGGPIQITPQGNFNGPSVDQWRKDHGKMLRETTSQHRLGKAADVKKPASMTYPQWADFVCELAAKGKLPANCGIGVYTAGDGFVHVDLGGRRGKYTRKGVKHF